MKSAKAFTLIETLIAMVIGVISVAAISYSYIYFNNTYQNILDKANMSQSGRSSLHQISKDLRNAGFKDVHYTKKNWDRWIEKKENYNNTGGDYLRIWYNTSSQDRLEVRYYLIKDAITQETSLVREMIENPETGDRKEMNCERFDTQKNCKPITIVSKASDFQVVLRDKNGNEINPVGLTSNTAKANQSKVHTAEIYVTVRSPNELLKKDHAFKITNHSGSTGRDFTKNDKYLRETFYISVYLRNVVKT